MAETPVCGGRFSEVVMVDLVATAFTRSEELAMPVIGHDRVVVRHCTAAKGHEGPHVWDSNAGEEMMPG